MCTQKHVALTAHHNNINLFTFTILHLKKIMMMRTFHLGEQKNISATNKRFYTTIYCVQSINLSSYLSLHVHECSVRGESSARGSSTHPFKKYVRFKVNLPLLARGSAVFRGGEDGRWSCNCLTCCSLGCSS